MDLFHRRMEWDGGEGTKGKKALVTLEELWDILTQFKEVDKKTRG